MSIFAYPLYRVIILILVNPLYNNIFKKAAPMVVRKQLKQKQITIKQTSTYQQTILHLKHSFFQILSAHLQQNNNTPSYLYSIFILFEHLAILWYIITPDLAVYKNVYMYEGVAKFLKELNFYSKLEEQPDKATVALVAVGIYFVLQYGLIAISSYGVLINKKGEIFKYFRKIVNYQFIITNKMLFGPLFALLVRIIYCTPSNSKHSNIVCYDVQGSSYTVIAGIFCIFLIIQMLVFSLIYFIKNPFNSSYMGFPNRYYIISKSVLKMMLPIYFMVDTSLSIISVYKFIIVGLLGFYIFWHRLFSIHSYNQKHFYYEYFLELCLFFIAFSNIVSYYVSNGQNQEKFSYLYCSAASFCFAGFMIALEMRFQDSFLKECLSIKIKKQNMEKFMYIIIQKLLYSNTQDSKLTFRVFAKILSKNIPLLYQEQSKQLKQQIHYFLFQLINFFLLQNNSIILKSMRCFVLSFLSKKTYGIHQSLELEEEKLTIVEEFMLYQFRESQKLYEKENDDKENRELIKFYRFYEEVGRLEEHVEKCCINCLEFWDQICEADPSFAKLRNLATIFYLYDQKISKQYEKINDIIPQNLYATNLYYSYLYHIGADIRKSLKIKQKMSMILQSEVKNTNISSFQEQIQKQQITIISLDTVGNNLGTILNCNSNISQLLGYDKNTLMGKHITKIMPKIYSQLHNSFMMKFIESENSHLKATSKIVTALDINSLLVQLNLTVRLLNSIKSDLALVGFVYKIQKKIEKGLIMFSGKNGQILAVNKIFTNIVNNKITGKQILQEEVRLASILPEITLDQLETNAEMVTFLEVGSSIDEYQTKQTQKSVKVSFKNFKIYDGDTLGFLQIADLDREEQAQKNLKLAQIAGNELLLQIKGSFEHIIQKNQRSSKRNYTQQLSLQLSQSMNELNPLQQTKQINMEVPIHRKIQEYIKYQETKKTSWITKIIYLIIIVGCSSMAIFIFIKQKNEMNYQNSLYQIMNQTLNIPYYESCINLEANKIWSINDISYRKGDLNVNFNKIARHLQLLKAAYSQLVRNLNNLSFPLQFNQNNYYNFTFPKAIQGKIQNKQQNVSFADGISNYITSTDIFTSQSNNSEMTKKYVIQIQAIFLMENGQDTLPKIGILAGNKVNSYIVEYIEDNINGTGILKIVFIAVITFCLSTLLILGKYGNKINLQIMELYSKFKINDVRKIITKQTMFLKERGIKQLVSKRQQLMSLLMAQSETRKSRKTLENKQKTNKQVRQKAKKWLQQQPQSQNLATQQPFLFTNTDQQALNYEDYPKQQKAECEQQVLKPKSQQILMVNIEWNMSFQKIIILLCLLVIIFTCLQALSFKNILENRHDIKHKISKLKDIGQIRKTLGFINYFGKRFAERITDENARLLLDAQIKTFYQITAKGYQYLGDPLPVLKNIYKSMQFIQQLQLSNNQSVAEIFFQKYQKVDDDIQQAIIDINNLDQSTFYQEYLLRLDEGVSNELIITIIIIIILLMAAFISNSMFLEPIQELGKQTLNMIRILPPWILNTNQQAYQIISKTN